MTKLTLSLLAAGVITVPVAGLAGLHLHTTAAKDSSLATVADARAPRVVELTISDDGVSPMQIPATKDEPIRLAITRTTSSTCITAVVMKDYGVNQPLPLHQTVNVDFTPTQSGKVRVACGMGMTFAVLAVQ